MKWYSAKALLSKRCIWNILLGQKGNGKSTAISRYCLEDAWNNNREFIYLRRWDLETTADKTEHYFALFEQNGWISEITKRKYNCLTVFRKTIYWGRRREDGTIERGKKCGYSVPLSGQEHYSSGQYPNVYNIIFEEFISKRQMYLENECSQLMFLVHTIFRHKENCKIFMIGNTISRLCPYFREWQLTKIPDMDLGQIDIYKYHNDDGSAVEIAVENSPTILKKSGVIFGNSRDSIVSGAWETSEMPRLPFKFNSKEVLYSIYFKEELIWFKISILKHDGHFCLFINEEKNFFEHSGVRIINRYARELNPLKTDMLYPLLEGDILIIDLLKKRHYFFSDNLTGAEFEDALPNLFNPRIG